MLEFNQWVDARRKEGKWFRTSLHRTGDTPKWNYRAYCPASSHVLVDNQFEEDNQDFVELNPDGFKVNSIFEGKLVLKSQDEKEEIVVQAVPPRRDKFGTFVDFVPAQVHNKYADYFSCETKVLAAEDPFGLEGFRLAYGPDRFDDKDFLSSFMGSPDFDVFRLNLQVGSGPNWDFYQDLTSVMVITRNPAISAKEALRRLKLSMKAMV